MAFLYSGPGIISLKGTYYVKFLFYMVFEALNINVCAAVHVRSHPIMVKIHPLLFFKSLLIIRVV